MLMTLLTDHGPVLAQYADAPSAHAWLAETQQQLAAPDFLRKIGKAIFGVLAGIFIVGALIGLLIGFFVGRAVGRNSAAPDRADR